MFTVGLDLGQILKLLSINISYGGMCLFTQHLLELACLAGVPCNSEEG